MKILLLILLILFSIAVYAQDEEITETDTEVVEEVTADPEVEVLEEIPADSEVIGDDASSDTEIIEEEIPTDVDEEVVSEETSEDSPVIEEENLPQDEEVVEEDLAPEQPSEPVKVMESTTSADIKNKFRNIKTLKSTQEEEVKIDIRKPDDSSIMPRKKTDFEYLQKRDMEEKLKKSNKMLY